MIVESTAEDIVYTPFFSGVHGSYLKPSIRNAGLDPDNLPVPEEAPVHARATNDPDLERHLGRRPGCG